MFVVTVSDWALMEFLASADKAGVEVAPLGRTIKNRIIFERPDRDCAISLDDLRRAHEEFFPRLMGADAALA